VTTEDLHDRTAEVLDQLCALIRQFAVNGAEHDAVRASAESVRRALVAAQLPFTIQLFSDAVLRDRCAMALELEGLRRCQQLVGALARFRAQEIAFDESVTLEALIEFGAALFGAGHKGSTKLPTLCGIRVSPAGRLASSGSPSDDPARDVFLNRHLERLCHEATQLTLEPSRPWNWEIGRALARRIERGLAFGVTASGRVFETAALPWTRARRIVGAAQHVGTVLARLQISPLTQRAATHAMLVLAAYGLRERSGIPFHEAARAAAPLLLAISRQGEEHEAVDCEPDPHRLRVCALVSEAIKLDGKTAPTLPLVPLLHVAYELERRRVPSDAAVTLTVVDLQAWLADSLGQDVHAGWGRAWLSALGLIPVGSHVLADGRLGVVMGPSKTGDPWHPKVLVGGQIVVPTQPITIHSPLGMTPWAKPTG